MELSFVFLLYAVIACINSNMANGCLAVEREALLAFKASINDPGNLLSSWHAQDCCNWWGVVCDDKTGYVIKLNLSNPYNSELAFTYSGLSPYTWTGEINPSLLALRYLTHLDLSMNDFSAISIPDFIGSFENMIYLDLSFSMFTGHIPYQLGNLSKLSYLDLGWSMFSGMFPPQLGNLSRLQFLNLSTPYPILNNHVQDISWISQLSSLNDLDMSGWNLNNTNNWLEINKLQNLKTLILSSCNLTGESIPPYHSYVNLTSLKTLELSQNHFNIELPSWLWNLTSLSCLDLSFSDFIGVVPDALSKLVLLNYLNLGGNVFNPGFLEPIQKLCNLKTIHLSSLQIEGDIGTLIRKLSCNWYQLEEVVLIRNNLQGNLPRWIGKISNLSYLDLYDNSLSGPLPHEIGRLSELSYLSLSNNSLSGHVPFEIGRLSKLNTLDLSFNLFSGILTEIHFANLTMLERLSLNNMPLEIKLNDKWIPPFQLGVLVLNYCVLGSFPGWLRGQTQLGVLDMSNSNISGTIPTWLWKFPVQYVDLSHNNLRGNLPVSLQSTQLVELHLESNNFEGPLPLSYPLELESLELSNNKLTGPLPRIINGTNLKSFLISTNQINGTLPSDICEMTNLKILDLSHNEISGELPICWKMPELQLLDLSNNNITGRIPNSIGSYQKLESLQLGSNNLNSELPSDLQLCKELIFLDLNINNFSGKIPTWIGEKLQNLVVLGLRSNMFSGKIPSNLEQLERLQVLDLSINALTGSIPRSFGNFTNMRNKTLHSNVNVNEKYMHLFFYQSDEYFNTLSVNMKGQQLYYTRTLGFVKTIDLSTNHLSGGIPEEIVALHGLINLNLSENHLSGRIPKNIGMMQSLQSLDLSTNGLSGSIPQTLSELYSLSSLNLSYNNLSGMIPSGRQLDTLNGNGASIYEGNPYLCGPPTGKSCLEGEATSTNDNVNVDSHDMIWLSIFVGLGFITGFWCACGAFVFKVTWRIIYFQTVDKFFDVVYVQFILTIRKLKEICK